MIYKSYPDVAGTVGTSKYMRDFPVATYSLVLLSIILYIGTLPRDRVDLANRYGLIPELLEAHRLFTSIFLHFDPSHLIVNVVFLWLFGRKVERAMGPLEFLLFYIGSGFTASLLHMAVTYAFLPPNMLRMPVVGASGAVAGVLGMYAIRFSHEKVSVRHWEIPAVYLLLAWLLIQAAFGIAGIVAPTIGPVDLRNVGYWSHIGGFVFGMTAAWVTTSRKSSASKSASGVRHSELRRQTLLEVAERYQTLSTADPLDPFPYAELGRVWALLSNQANSIENYLKAIEYYRKEGKKDEGLACVKETLHFWPVSTLPHDVTFRLACYFETLGAPEEAIKHFTWLSDSAKDSLESEMALVKLAQIELDRLNQPHLAIEAIKRLKTEYPESKWMEIADQVLNRALACGDPPASAE